MNTRSLSLCILPGNETSTLKYGLLFYENPTGKVAVLRNTAFRQDNNWVDITSQERRSLPDTFPIAPGLDRIDSPTLYKLDSNATFSTPFTCTTDINGHIVQLLYYSSNATDTIKGIDYGADFSGDIGFHRDLCYADSGPQ